MNPDFPPTPFSAKDGVPLTARPIFPDDAQRLQNMARHLTATSIYNRFLTFRTTLTDEELHRLTHIDYHTHMAIVALTAPPETAIVGVARYITPPGQSGAAEVGVIVRDDYQKRGIGTQLMKFLTAYAARHGIHTFLASVHVSNAAVLGFLRHVPYPVERHLDGTLWNVAIRLHPPETT